MKTGKYKVQTESTYKLPNERESKWKSKQEGYLREVFMDSSQRM